MTWTWTPEETAVLEERALRLASPLPERERGTDHLVVRAGREHVALPTGRLLGAMRLPPISPVPHLAPPWLGLVVVRARVHPAASLRALLEGEPVPTDEPGFLLLVGGLAPVGLVVDDVVGHRGLATDGPVARPHPLVLSTTSDLVHRLDLVAILDSLSGVRPDLSQEDHR